MPKAAASTKVVAAGLSEEFGTGLGLIAPGVQILRPPTDERSSLPNVDVWITNIVLRKTTQAQRNSGSALALEAEEAARVG